MYTYVIFVRVHPARLFLLILAILMTAGLLALVIEAGVLYHGSWGYQRPYLSNNRTTFVTNEYCNVTHPEMRPMLRYKHSDGDKNAVPLAFDCRLYKFIDELELDSTSLQNHNRETVFVTAVSHPFREHLFRLIYSIRQYYKKELIIVYDLGLRCETWHKLVELCGVEVRFFNYRKYPPHVRHIKEFRWKPIIIAETLKQFGTVWYFDSSVILTKPGYLEKVQALTTCRKSSEMHINSSLLPERSGLPEMYVYNHNLEHCTKATVLLHGYSGHGIFAATEPYVYKYLPPKRKYFRTDRSLMYDAGLIFWNRDQRNTKKVLKWWVLCALTADCMRNHVSIQRCEFSQTSPWSTFADCHRFDQSVLNLLLFNEYYQNTRFYVSELTGFFKIEREIEVQDYVSSENITCYGE